MKKFWNKLSKYEKIVLVVAIFLLSWIFELAPVRFLVDVIEDTINSPIVIGVFVYYVIKFDLIQSIKKEIN